MKPETKRYLTEYIIKNISELETIQDGLANNIKDYTTGGPIRSEKTELDQLRLTQQLNAVSLINLRKIQQLLPQAPIGLDSAAEWAEVELNYVEDEYREVVLLVPDEITGIKTPEVLMVSPASPLGISIRNHRSGNSISLSVNGGSLEIEILSIS